MTTLNRRQFLQTSLAYGLTWPYLSALAAEPNRFTLPAEYAKHHSTWMAHGVQPRFWPKEFVPPIRNNLVLIAQTIAKYEPVSLLIRPNEQERIQEFYGNSVTYVPHPLDNLWIRDSSPSLLINAAGQLQAIDAHFKGWDQPEAYKHDSQLAKFMAQQLQAELLEADFELDGSNLEVDGAGTAILTESSVYYQGRNSDLAKAQLEARLQRLMGIQKVIWLPGNPTGNLAERRTDYYARFVQVGKVLVSHEPNPDFQEHALTLRHQDILNQATDANGKRLEVIVLNKPKGARVEFISSNFASSYLGFYVCNKAVLMQEFGDVLTDNAARRALQTAYPEHKIELLNIDALASGGASIHSVTRQQPSL
ncbi:agmatine/peptidylarginine deiminase [uncultured Thiothrix sp.]|uniref:agmatine deiminase family protein n=1 Tax=uncultured Thiothrix sp. TaxID=223185 RepID=UPI00263623D8|nr:agmatine deiminase family protein [uncultured Thiothrix sp.]